MEQPTTLVEAIKQFSDESRAHEYLTSMRWPDGKVTCPHCEGVQATFMPKYRRWVCLNQACKKQFSAKSGTIFEKSQVSLGNWLTAIWLISSAKNGISSCELARSLGVTQKTAWFMEHRIREAMKRGSFAKMEGTVEVDETVIGQKSKTMHADKRQEMRERGFPKTIVLGMRERGGDVRTMVVADTTADTLQGEIVKNVEAGSRVYTDTWKGYNGMSAAYQHATVNHKAGQYVDGDVTTNGMEGYWNLLKRGYRGTYVIMSPQHTHRYLAEEDFRYNTRQEEDGDRFAQVVASVAGKRLTYRELTESHLVNLDRG